jgi:hypothetical protein
LLERRAFLFASEAALTTAARLRGSVATQIVARA